MPDHVIDIVGGHFHPGPLQNTKVHEGFGFV
jgi:hypothetical protein